jgi:hypothetical protein
MVTFTGSIANRQLYVKDMFLTNDTQYAPTGVIDLMSKPQPSNVDVYSLSGQLLRRSVQRQKATLDLPSGIYVIDGKKVLVK